jgi:hypothetical protein
MHLTQFLIFEICAECNRGQEHAWCPNRHPERFARSAGRRPVTDEQILAIVRAAYGRHGFRGLVGWHYYNEPLCAWPRLRSLMARIAQEVSAVRFVLWTNGDRLPPDLGELRAFGQIHVTNYGGRDFSALQAGIPGVRVWPPTPDRRLAGAGPESLRPCRRPFVEIIVDHYGNVHPCCYDWRGCVALGNVHDQPWSALLERWQAFRSSVSGPAMTQEAPAACRTCALRSDRIPDFVPEIAAAARRASVAPMPAPLPRPTGVVLVHYRMPRERLDQHLARNAQAYRGARLYVVAEADLGLGGSATTVVVPEEALPLLGDRRAFSLAATKNAGVARAIVDGCEVVVVTDSDCELPPDTFRALAEVGPGAAVIPTYRMRTWPDRADPQDHDDPGCTGTLAMRSAWWREIRFDERCVGYGGEDGALLRAIREAGLAIDRARTVWHHAHTPGHNPRRTPGDGMADCWGRTSGFNPDNFLANRSAART